jgi:transcriptional regulator with XRE-family HTH domain
LTLSILKAAIMPHPPGRVLGDFLRSRRETLSPKSVGLRPGQRRRTAGLRREEVAELAGIGVDWYIRLEQGRATRPSVTTIDALARALRFTKAEHAHLRALAATADRRPFVRESVPPSIALLVESMNLPAYVTGRRWDILAWNDPADEIFGFSKRPVEDRNILLNMMIGKDARQLFGKAWPDEAKRMLALFRTTHDLWAGDPAFEELSARLRAGCPEFGGWWDKHDVGTAVAGVKSLTPTKRGIERLAYATFQSNDAPDLKLTIYRPA